MVWLIWCHWMGTLESNLSLLVFPTDFIAHALLSLIILIHKINRMPILQNRFRIYLNFLIFIFKGGRSRIGLILIRWTNGNNFLWIRDKLIGVDPFEMIVLIFLIVDIIISQRSIIDEGISLIWVCMGRRDDAIATLIRI